MNEKNLQYLLYGLIVLGVLIAGYALFSSTQQGGPSPTAQGSGSPAPETAKLTITSIIVPDCRICTNLTALIDGIKLEQNVEITSFKTLRASEAQDLIAKYNITKIPTVLVSGETFKAPQLVEAWKAIGEQKQDGTLVLTKVRPLYLDLQSKKYVGQLKIMRLVNSSCDYCSKAFVIQDAIQTQNGIGFTEEQERDFNSTQGRELVAKYNITKIPALIISGEIGAYDEYGLKNWWTKNGGTVESDGSLVWRYTVPPYEELPSEKLKGLVTVIALEDPSCKTCYDVNVHVRILGTYGIQFKNVTYLNYTQPEAQALISKYNIKFVPTILSDKEMDEYYPFTNLQEVWKQVGTTEPDGWHLFSNLTSLGSNVTFRNLITNKTETT